MKEYKYDIIVALFGVGVTMLFFGFNWTLSSKIIL